MSRPDPMHQELLMPRSHSTSGFTLIELMIAVAVVAVLASIALPAYNDSVRKSRRAQAKADIVEYAQMAERFFTVNGTYTGFALPANQSPREGGTAHYTLQLASTATTFNITAAPAGTQAQDGCGGLGITQTGQKSRTGSYPFAKCW